MSNPTITLASFLNWLRRQPANEVFDHPVRTYCEQRFGSYSVIVRLKEISVGFRYAWTDTYSPDEGLSALIPKMTGKLSVAEILELAEEDLVEAGKEHLASVSGQL